MQVSELLQQMGGLGTIARELGVDERQVRSGAEALLPEILGGLKQQAQAQPSGAGGLLAGQVGWPACSTPTATGTPSTMRWEC